MTTADRLPVPDVTSEELLTAHAHGWARSKADGIEPWELGWRLAVRRAGEPERLVVTRTGDLQAVASALATVTLPGTTLRLLGDVGRWRELLPPGWVVDHEGWYYSRELARPLEAVPAPPTIEMVSSAADGLVSATVRLAGEPVATGVVGLWHEWAVPDNIEVAPGHRRRGYGRLLMGRLLDEARTAGATRAVLSSTRDGRGLYAATGWTEVGEQVCATYLPDGP